MFLRTLDLAWCITPGGYAAIKRLADSMLARSALPTETRQQDSSVVMRPGRLAMIGISGPLGLHLSDLETWLGGCDYDAIANSIDAALEEGAEGILFAFDSPGGLATGCPECAELIASLDVPTVAFTDSTMTSAAYWLASSCDYLMATNSADVGSIGVLMSWIDQTRLWDQIGIKYDPIVSEPGDTLKTTGGGPTLSAEQRSFLQEQVNQIAGEFRTHVSANRSVDYEALKAGWYSGQRALELNLIDQIGSQQDALNELAKRVS